MGVPPAYQHCTFNSFNKMLCPKYDLILQHASDSDWLVFVGEHSGKGKTHLAVASLGRSWWQTRRRDESRFRYYPMRQVGLELDLAGIEYEDKVRQILHNWHGGRYDCLLLDELGREPMRARDKIELIIDDIFLNYNQLIATSNLSYDAFCEIYDSSIIRRITERGAIIKADW